MKKNILILRSNPDNSKSISYRLYTDLKEVSRDNIALFLYSDVLFSITNDEIEITVGGINIKKFNLVYLRDFRGYEAERNAIAIYCKNTKIPFLNKDTATFQHYTKLTQMMSLAINNIPVPKSIYLSANYNAASEIINKIIGETVIAKGISSRKGEDNFLLRGGAELSSFLKNNSKTDNKFIYQNFIPNQWDYRVIIVGGKAAKTYRRQRDPSSDKHQNNMAQGGIVTAISKPNKKVTKLAENAARIVNRQICGVDVLENSVDGSFVILEINDNSDNFHNDPYSNEIVSLSKLLHREAS